MLPTVNNDTMRSVAYAAEVAGRVQGVATMSGLVPDGEKRGALERSASRILATAREAAAAAAARTTAEYLDGRIAVGKGRGVDRGFDALVASCAEKIRTSLPDRRTDNPDYRAVFPDGSTAEYLNPTIRQDPDLCLSLRHAVEASSVAPKAEILAALDAIQPQLEAAANASRAAEEQVNNLFAAELAARKKLVDALWEERKVIEQTLGRGGRGVARFIFFDFRPVSGSEPAPEAPAEPAGGTGPVPQ